MRKRVKEILNNLEIPPSQKAEEDPVKADSEEHIKLKQQFVYQDDRWVPLTIQELLDVKIGYFLDETKRIILKFEYKAEVIYVTSHRQDYDSMKLKYPKALVIDVCQLLKLWTGHISLEDNTDPIFRVIPQFIFIEKNIPGVKIVSHLTK